MFWAGMKFPRWGVWALTREVDLLSCLPPFMAEYQEVAVTLRAEAPEFRLLWEAVEGSIKTSSFWTRTNTGYHVLNACLNCTLMTPTRWRCAACGF